MALNEVQLELQRLRSQNQPNEVQAALAQLREQPQPEPEKPEGFLKSIFGKVAEVGVGLRGLQKGVTEILPRRDETGKLKMGDPKKLERNWRRNVRCHS